MKLTIVDARSLVGSSLSWLGYDDPDLATIAAHLMDCELRGPSYGGLARLLSIADRRHAPGPPDEARRRFEAGVAEYAAAVRATQPVEGGCPGADAVSTARGSSGGAASRQG